MTYLNVTTSAIEEQTYFHSILQDIVVDIQPDQLHEDAQERRLDKNLVLHQHMSHSSHDKANITLLGWGNSSEDIY